MCHFIKKNKSESFIINYPIRNSSKNKDTREVKNDKKFKYYSINTKIPSIKIYT